MLIKFLILFFIMLIFYQIFLAIFGENIIEGMEGEASSSYQNYGNDPLILAKQNAGNIEYLKGQVTGLQGLDKKVDDISKNVDTLNTQVIALVQQQADAAQQMVGNKPLNISGAAA